MLPAKDPASASETAAEADAVVHDDSKNTGFGRRGRGEIRPSRQRVASKKDVAKKQRASTKMGLHFA